MEHRFLVGSGSDFRLNIFLFFLTDWLGSKWCSLIRFLKNLTQKGSFGRAKYDFYFFLLVLTVHGRFFHGFGSGFFDDPDPDSGKKSDPDPEKPGSKTLVTGHTQTTNQNLKISAISPHSLPCSAWALVLTGWAGCPYPGSSRTASRGCRCGRHSCQTPRGWGRRRDRPA